MDEAITVPKNNYNIIMWLYFFGPVRDGTSCTLCYHLRVRVFSNRRCQTNFVANLAEINKRLSNHAPSPTVHQTLISEVLVATESQRTHWAYREKTCILSQSLHLLLALFFWCNLAKRLFILKLTRQSYLE